MDGWEDLAVGRDAHAIASRIIAECTTFNFAALRDNLGAVMGSVGIEGGDPRTDSSKPVCGGEAATTARNRQRSTSTGDLPP